MTQRKRKLTVAVLPFLTVLLAGLVCYSPHYLTCSDVPQKSDAVVLFIGPESEARLNEARELIRAGYARYLVIPAYGETLQITTNGMREVASKKLLLKSETLTTRKAAYYKKYYEDTHVEALEAKRMMDEHGLRSAILVSSPYHMRRIKLIGSRVFGRSLYSLTLAPTRFQASYTVADWLNKERRETIFSEYLKMGWYLFYAC
ncbi:MAG: hypothetical protein FD174_1651 [Geobacteraceae bacterium]|nr:MAG: hypothetical protein FD174_1651 [Geobacteraceae bacterium]